MITHPTGLEIYGAIKNNWSLNQVPISELSPEMNDFWEVKAKVQSKSTIMKWNKIASKGRYFFMYLSDGSGTIKATGFDKECDSLFPDIEVSIFCKKYF